MSDIVERLRSGAAHKVLVTTGLVNQAADEITALRAENERLRAIMNTADALRSAIREAGVKRHCSKLYMSVCAFDSARAALKEKPHE